MIVMYRKLLRTALLSVLAAVETGCAVGPHYKAPQPAPVTLHSADPNFVTQQTFDPRWWKQLDDPVLDGLIDKTLSANQDIRIAQLRLVQSRATYDERKLDRYPVAPLDAGLEEMRSAIRQMDQIHFGADEANAFEPPRGPANVSYLPLNPAPLAFQADSRAKAGVHELKAAMMLAGLSDSR